MAQTGWRIRRHLFSTCSKFSLACLYMQFPLYQPSPRPPYSVQSFYLSIVSFTFLCLFLFSFSHIPPPLQTTRLYSKFVSECFHKTESGNEILNLHGNVLTSLSLAMFSKAKGWGGIGIITCPHNRMIVQYSSDNQVMTRLNLAMFSQV